MESKPGVVLHQLYHVVLEACGAFVFCCDTTQMKHQVVDNLCMGCMRTGLRGR